MTRALWLQKRWLSYVEADWQKLSTCRLDPGASEMQHLLVSESWLRRGETQTETERERERCTDFYKTALHIAFVVQRRYDFWTTEQLDTTSKESVPEWMRSAAVVQVMNQGWSSRMIMRLCQGAL